MLCAMQYAEPSWRVPALVLCWARSGLRWIHAVDWVADVCAITAAAAVVSTGGCLGDH
jgi:hypothetical protein